MCLSYSISKIFLLHSIICLLLRSAYSIYWNVIVTRMILFMLFDSLEVFLLYSICCFPAIVWCLFGRNCYSCYFWWVLNLFASVSWFVRGIYCTPRYLWISRHWIVSQWLQLQFWCKFALHVMHSIPLMDHVHTAQGAIVVVLESVEDAVFVEPVVTSVVFAIVSLF